MLLISSTTPPAATAGTTGEIQAFINRHWDTIIDYGLRAVGVLVLLIIAWIIAGWISRILGRGLRKARIDETITRFVARSVRWVVLALTLLSCLSVFGVEVTSFAAILAATGFAIGMAFQGTLSNFSAGIMLLVFRPFKVSDVVSVAGSTGKINAIDLFTTTMDTPDNRRLILPNSQVFGATIENVTFHDTRRVDVEVGVDYSAAIQKTRDVLNDAVNDLALRLHEPAPAVVLTGLGDSSVNWAVRVWVNTPDFWTVKEALTESVKNRLDAADIGIPYPNLELSGTIETRAV